MQELEVAARLSHPALSLPIAYGQDLEGKYRIVFRYMDTSLDKVFKDARLGAAREEWDVTRRSIVAFGIVAAMAYLHRNGIVHRDLKPANILLDREMRPYVADFGISKAIPRDRLVERSRDRLGTPLYNAPELMAGKTYSWPIDVYAWAFIYYELVADAMPFHEIGDFASITDAKIWERVKKGIRPKRTDDFEEKQWEILQACWHQDPNQRPTFEQLLQRPDDIRLPDCDERDFADYLEFLGPN
jgi:serine/threonine protein kinase